MPPSSVVWVTVCLTKTWSIHVGMEAGYAFKTDKFVLPCVNNFRIIHLDNSAEAPCC